jgi:S-adenosylmethionine:tRNA ribosyltransferase-isomerase
MMTHLSDYDYDLPDELIAQHPLPQRVDSRLMLVNRGTGEIAHHHVRDLPQILAAGDCLVLNDTRVVPARLVGRRALTGGRWEGLFLAADPSGNWKLLSRTRGKLSPGESVLLDAGDGSPPLEIRFVEKQPDGIWVGRPLAEAGAFELLERVGTTPLPCYIRQGLAAPSDASRYQTVYARVPGSAAAPTAGLHFSEELLARLKAGGIQQAYVTLHVGLDTFRPIKTDSLAEHQMHAEWGEMPAGTKNQLAQVRQAGRRIVAVGTTSVRVLETAAQSDTPSAWRGETRLFIRPGHRFRLVDALLTNFHLPRSTLLVLVRTFGGDELIRQAYAEAIRQRYRFYSYGDAMLIV